MGVDINSGHNQQKNRDISPGRGVKGNLSVGKASINTSNRGGMMMQQQKNSLKKQLSPAKINLRPQQSPSAVWEKIYEEQDDIWNLYFLESMPAYEALLWEPSVELSQFAHQTWKTQRWKQVLRNPYMLVFALNYIHSSERKWEFEPELPISHEDFLEAMPSYDCVNWEPSHQLSQFPHQTWKTQSWKKALRNPYVKVFALNFQSFLENRWEFDHSIRWCDFLDEMPSYDSELWKPSKELSKFPHQSLKTNRWKQILKNPYYPVFALNWECLKEPRWETPVASYDCFEWEPSKELSKFPHQSLKTNRWKQILKNPYYPVFALAYKHSNEPKWT